MPLSIHIPELAENVLQPSEILRIFLNGDRESDNGRQAETADRHRILSVRRV
jgi:hypothetical protein